MSENAAVQAVINSVNALNREDRRRLSVAVRTTHLGVKAYNAFNYGTGEALVSIIVPPPGSDTGNSDSSTNQGDSIDA